VCSLKSLVLNAVADDSPQYDFMLKKSVSGRLCQFLTAGCTEQMQFEAAWVITNLACGSPAHVSELISCGAVQRLIQLVSSATIPSLREQALWALGNLSVDSHVARQIMLENFIIETVMGVVGCAIIKPPPRGSVVAGTARPADGAPVQVRAVENLEPSLSTVKHIAWICSNLSW
jgi:hypothetical protein